MHYVIIGCSAAGISAAEAIRSKDKKSKITIVSDEKRPLYSRCLISYLLAGTIGEDKLWYRPDSFFKKNKAEAVLGVKAERLDVKKKELGLQGGKKLRFDKLLIATGASPKMEAVPGADKKGVYPLRTIEHTADILSVLDKAQKVAVLGGGLIGLRAAYALNNRGKEVTVFVRSPQVLSQIIDKPAAAMMQKRIEEKGIRIKTGRSAKEIRGDKSVEEIILDDGSRHACELVIIGKGVKPNLDIAKDAGIKTDWGILADEFLRTSAEDMFAAGDVAETHDIALGKSSINAVWPAACEQGRIAGVNMAGEKRSYAGTLAMNSLEFFGLPVISMGITRPKKGIYEELVREDAEKQVYKKIVLRNGVVVGALFVNSVDTIGIIGTLIKNKIDISKLRDIVLEEYLDYGRIAKLIKDSGHIFKEAEFRETTMTL